ncbi:MAG: hypothetical protein ACC630_07000 [Nitrospinota bacterium]
MGIYKNDYNKEEDEVLWELHEIRHELSKEYKSMSIDEINERAKNYWENVKKERKTKKVFIASV